MKHNLLLLSNSQVHGRGYLDHALVALRDLLDGRRSVLFAPFALRDHDGYVARIAEALAPLGVSVRGLHAEADPLAAVRAAEVLYVGGGNSFRLLRALRDRGLVGAVRERVAAGELAYVGSSAGTNMACPTLRTTNDMPILQPDSFEAFGLVPFQVNPHYLDADPGSTHMGETRAQRIAQFLEENDVPVLGMREGAWLRRRGERLELGGETGALLFLRGEEPRPFGAGDDLSFLLTTPARFDSPLP
jgi:dipeptidase E